MVLKNGRKVSIDSTPYIVAEMNSSHRGKIDVAKQMIAAAKESGCDAVKFQSWSAESLYCKDYYDMNPMSKRMVKGFSLSPEALVELSGYCNEIGIDFSSTPYSNDEVDILIDKCNAPFVKIASMDINNIPFLRYIAKRSVPIVLSTGMSTIEEIKCAVETIEQAGNRDICILHCVSLYPVDSEGVNLNNMVMIKNTFSDYSVGYSDHTVGSEVACAAVGLGAVLIEKHFTLNNKKIGWDNQMATEPLEMKELVDKCRNVHKSLGSYERSVSQGEMDQRIKMRRSIVAAVELEAGHIIAEGDITAKRPEEGIPVNHYQKLIGRQVIKDIEKDQMIKWSDLG